MKKKLFTLSLLTISLLTTQVQAANRCLSMIDKHVNQDQLDLSYCQITNEDMPAIISYLANHPNIKSLNFSGNLIDSSAIATLAQNTTISILNVRGDDIDVDGAKALANNSTLTELDISDNKIS